MARKSGVLMHVSSLYGEYSVGSFGNEAREFVDFLAESGFSIWQTLPFCMPDECNSPYKSYSSFGANPYFIDLPTLYRKGYITEEELLSAKQGTPYLAEYGRLASERLPLLSRAAERAALDGEVKGAVKKFISERDELYRAAKFLALREENGGAPWQEWTVDEPSERSLFKWEFIQYEFFSQWRELKAYANGKGIEIIGDLPIYVALDSADVWSEPEQFLLDSKGYPTAVAGVPPDYFSADGQLWGNPLYNYKKMKLDGYSWWQRRIKFMLELFDGVRIDHFRGLEAFYSIPASASSAKEGKWVKAPGRALVDAIRESAKGKRLIAEDLGDITEKVISLVKYSGFPGMRVLQFAFLGDENTPHLPHNYDKNTVVYSGTHDNNTLLGYIWELDDLTRHRVFDYFGYRGEDFDEGCRFILRSLLATPADTVIFPIQDLLLYGADTRMNTPGRSEGNWAYRITRGQLGEIDRRKYRDLNKLYGRI